jgi:hypothetical protein
LSISQNQKSAKSRRRRSQVRMNVTAGAAKRSRHVGAGGAFPHPSV